MPDKCLAIAHSGARCQSPAMPGEDYCWTHSPATLEARRAAAVRGGHARSNRARAEKLLPDGLSAAELVTRLSLLFIAASEKRIEPKVAVAAANVARVLLEAMRFAEEPQVAELRAEAESLRALIAHQGRLA